MNTHISWPEGKDDLGGGYFPLAALAARRAVPFPRVPPSLPLSCPCGLRPDSAFITLRQSSGLSAWLRSYPTQPPSYPQRHATATVILLNSLTPSLSCLKPFRGHPVLSSDAGLLATAHMAHGFYWLPGSAVSSLPLCFLLKGEVPGTPAISSFQDLGSPSWSTSLLPQPPCLGPSSSSSPPSLSFCVTSSTSLS